jgi:hypothetical protein
VQTYTYFNGPRRDRAALRATVRGAQPVPVDPIDAFHTDRLAHVGSFSGSVLERLAEDAIEGYWIPLTPRLTFT